MGIKEFIPFFREEKKEEEEKKEKEPIVERRDEIRTLEDKIKVLKIIISRYKEIIQRGETKTIADLKLMIVPDNETIVKKRNEITDKIRPYIYEQHFLDAAEEAHKIVSQIRTYSLQIDFWLTPEELIDLKGGDPMDKAIFLCSLLIALENIDSYVIVGINKGTKVAVGFTFNNEFHILDPISEIHNKGEKEEIINKWFEDDKKIYEFNDRDYNEIKGEEERIETGT